MRKQADYLIGEALVAAPGDRRLHLITGMIEDLKRLTAEQSNTGGPQLGCPPICCSLLCEPWFRAWLHVTLLWQLCHFA